MEMCWRSAAAASARGARQWRCAGEEQLRQAQGALANGDVLAKTSGGQRKGRSPMEMCWRGAAVASARGARQWRWAGKTAAASAGGARQWRCAGEEDLWQATYFRSRLYIICVVEIYIYLYIFSLSILYLSRFIVDFFYACVRHICICVDSLTQLSGSLRGLQGLCRVSAIYIYIY